MSFIKATPEGALLRVKATPKAGRDAIGPVHDDELKVALTVAPEKGKANERLIKILAQKLDLPKSAFTLLSGSTDRHKTLLVRGLAPDAIRTRLLAE